MSEIASERAHYVLRFFPELMTPEEAQAYRHLSATYKAADGRSDQAAQAEVKGHPVRSTLLSDDPAVLVLAADGLGPFMERTSERILRDAPDKVFLNNCPRCGVLTRTPTAQLCLACGHSWHQASKG